MIAYILTKFSGNLFIFVDDGVQTKSDSSIFPIQGKITPDVLIQFDP